MAKSYLELDLNAIGDYVRMLRKIFCIFGSAEDTDTIL